MFQNIFAVPNAPCGVERFERIQKGMFQNIFAVPNAPCGVESYIKSFSFEFAHSVFLMHRVELKVLLLEFASQTFQYAFCS